MSCGGQPRAACIPEDGFRPQASNLCSGAQVPPNCQPPQSNLDPECCSVLIAAQPPPVYMEVSCKPVQVQYPPPCPAIVEACNGGGSSQSPMAVPVGGGSVGGGNDLTSMAAICGSEVDGVNGAQYPSMRASDGARQRMKAFRRKDPHPIYRVCEGLLPTYGGHVPNQQFRFGGTYGRETLNARNLPKRNGSC